MRLQNFVPVNRSLHAVCLGVNQDAKFSAMYEAADVKGGQPQRLALAIALAAAAGLAVEDGRVLNP
jgi:hypothetical protein